MTKSKNKRPLGSYVDADGRAVTEVELTSGDCARILTEDLRRLEDLGIRPNWSWNDNGAGKGQRYVTGHHRSVRSGNGLVRIARLITRAGPHQHVQYRDGDTLNLLPENLIVTRGSADGRERAVFGVVRVSK